MTVLFENVQFLSGASGATTKRTPATRAADIFNIKDFGALGDGSTDDTVAINLAIATGASNNGTIFFPKGTGAYKTTSAILLPVGANLVITAAPGASIVGNFNGFILDNLSDPVNEVSGVMVIENLNIQNGFIGNRFSMAVAGSWSASGSPVSILLSGSNPGVAAGGALWITGGVNAVFIGMITSVASWPTVTVSSAAASSASISGGALTAQILQCYAAGASWSNGDATITMAATRPAGIGTGLYYVYNYENYLADPKYDFPLGTATWSGTTVTFVPGYSGAGGASIGSADRLWFAPVAGAIRLSSVVGATVRNCMISGFIGLTTSQDKIVPNGGAPGAAEGFHVECSTCNFGNPSGFSGLLGQTGIYYQNNSISLNNNFNSMWCAERFSGTACGAIGGRAEIGYFGTIIGGDTTASNNSLSLGFIKGRSFESNLLAIYGKSGGATITSTGASCNALASTVLGGFYLNAFSGSMDNSGAIGNFGTAYGIYIADPNNSRTNVTFTSCYATNSTTPANSWRTPAQAWAASYIQCLSNSLALSPVYLYANLPGVGANTAAVEGDEYNISDGTNGLTWGQTATNTGTHTTHYKVRFNGSNWTVMGM